MPAQQIFSDYDRFAWFYNRYWGGEFSRPALSIYNVILFPHLTPGCRVLDLCCGTGQIAAGLIERGFQVTGIDGSEAMLNFARENAPQAHFVHADARSFELPKEFEAALSAFDSLNHIMELDQLIAVFRRVHSVLLDHGIFLFDLNLEEETETPNNSIDIVGGDHACIVRSSYDPSGGMKRYDVTMFNKEGESWQRSDLSLFQRFYTTTEVLGALADAGFTNVKAYDARREFGFTLSDGRVFYLARK
jgi:SAM-dependent methyltransferase